MVLAKLAGGVAEIEQELCQAWRAGSQIARTAGQLRRDHARAQRMHAGDERVAPGSATLLSVVVHEDRAFFRDTVNVGGFPDHQTAVIATRLHPFWRRHRLGRPCRSITWWGVYRYLGNESDFAGWS